MFSRRRETGSPSAEGWNSANSQNGKRNTDLIMWFFKRLFRKSTSGSSAITPSSEGPVFTPLSVEQSIAAWRKINANVDRPWALFEHGTCVWLAEPDGDVFSQARSLLAEWGPVYAGSSAGDFNVVPARGTPGWLVTCHHPDIVTLVFHSPRPERSGQDRETADLAIGLFGRSLRDLDARKLGVVHIEDRRASGTLPEYESVEVWARLANRAWRARQEQSDWKRYAVPMDAIEFLTEREAHAPRRSLDEVSMPDEVRTQVEALESVVRKSGRLSKPITAWCGLTLSGMPPCDKTSVRDAFRDGQVVELRGFLSASSLVDPPI
jgi:hypothetical protein